MDAEDGRDLDAERLPAGFERWKVTVAAGAERPTSAAEWSDALVVVERGAIEVVCLGGGRRVFGQGSYLCLSWLPVVSLRNPGRSDAVLLARRRARRADERVAVPFPA